MNASEIAKALGRRGGRARAARLGAADRTRIAALGARARIQSLDAARRIEDNMRYAAAMDELRPRRAVTSLKTFAGPLPDLSAPRNGE